MQISWTTNKNRFHQGKYNGLLSNGIVFHIWLCYARPMKKEKGLLPYLGLMVAMILWGNSFIMIKLAYQAFSPNFVMFARMFLASLCVVPFLKSFLKKLQKKDIPLLLLMAVFEPVLYFSFEAQALRYTTASQASMIVALLPLLVAVPSFFILKERLHLNMLIGFGLAIGGALWLSFSSQASEHGPNPLLGNTLEFLAMVSATGYTILCRKLSARYSALMLTAVQSFLGAFYFLIRLLISPEGLPTVFPLVPSLSILALGILVSLGAYGLYNYGIANTSATGAAVFVNLIPLVTLVSALIILREPIGPKQYYSSAIILAGVILSQLDFKKIQSRSLKTPTKESSESISP